MQIISHALLETPYNLIMMLLIHTDAENSILLCHGFSEKNILSLLSKHTRQIFDNLYQDQVLSRDNLGSFTLDDTTAMMWATFHSHEVMTDFSEREIECHPSFTSIFVRSLITSNISEPLQEIFQMKRDINFLSTN